MSSASESNVVAKQPARFVVGRCTPFDTSKDVSFGPTKYFVMWAGCRPPHDHIAKEYDTEEEARRACEELNRQHGLLPNASQSTRWVVTIDGGDKAHHLADWLHALPTNARVLRVEPSEDSPNGSVKIHFELEQ